MELIIKGEEKEIADLLLKVQGQRDREYSPLEVIREAVQKATDDTEPKELLSS